MQRNRKEVGVIWLIYLLKSHLLLNFWPRYHIKSSSMLEYSCNVNLGTPSYLIWTFSSISRVGPHPPTASWTSFFSWLLRHTLVFLQPPGFSSLFQTSAILFDHKKLQPWLFLSIQSSNFMLWNTTYFLISPSCWTYYKLQTHAHNL